MAVAIAVLLVQAVNAPGQAGGQVEAPLPNPVLRFTGVEEYTAHDVQWIRHRYDVLNKDRYPGTMFASAPDLPPCGLNTKSSRAWVDFFDSRGKRLYGFCALASPNDLGSIWFSTQAGAGSPGRIYVEITDRQTGLKYKSNLARTEPPVKARSKRRQR